MKSYNVLKANATMLKVNECIVGQRIEDRVRRMVYNQEPIGDGAPLIYTDRRNGVEPQYNIRTDRFEQALDAMNGVHERKMENRYEIYKPKEAEETKGDVNDAK